MYAETAHDWMEVRIIGTVCLFWLLGRGEMEKEYKCEMKKKLLNSHKKASEEQ